MKIAPVLDLPGELALPIANRAPDDVTARMPFVEKGFPAR
jgi:hypothetical protein